MKKKLRKKTAKNLVRQIEAHKNAIAKERDALRALIGEVEEITDGADDATDDLERAVDRLSEYL